MAEMKGMASPMILGAATAIQTPEATRTPEFVTETVRTRVQHLHLHMKRTHWETKHHDNLGAHLQDALDVLDREGWEVAAAYVINCTPEVILRRTT